MQLTSTKEKVRQLLDDPDDDSEWKSKALVEAAKKRDRENSCHSSFKRS